MSSRGIAFIFVVVTYFLVDVWALWPKPVAPIHVPLGRVLSANNGLTNRTLTNVTVLVRHPGKPVWIENVTVYITRADCYAFDLDDPEPTIDLSHCGAFATNCWATAGLVIVGSDTKR